MEIQLSETLQSHLIQYDQDKRVVAEQATAQETARQRLANTRQTWTHGKVPAKIPFDILAKEVQETAIAEINRERVENRIREWTDKSGQTIAIIGHFEGAWYYWWVPPKSNKDYVYGLAVIVKDTAVSRKKIFETNASSGRILTSNTSPRSELAIKAEGDWPRKGVVYEDFTQFKIGRSAWAEWSALVTTEHLAQGFCRGWTPPQTFSGVHNGKGTRFRQVGNRAQETLKTRVPTWRDNTGQMFSRVRYNQDTIWYCMQQLSLAYNSKGSIFDGKTWGPEIFEHTAEWYIERFLARDILATQELRSFYDRPAVLKMLREAVAESSGYFELSQSDNTDYWFMGYVTAPVYKFYHWLTWCHQILHVWPSCPIDHLLNNYDLLQDTMVINFIGKHDRVISWLNQNMPVESLFQIIKMKTPEILADESNSSRWYKKECKARRHISAEIRDLNDTLSMVNTILQSDRPLEKPRRWRLSEWHDFVQSEAWKVQHRNYDLPQDLFPQPFKATVDGTKLCFIQPIDAHQLAAWGQAARNCVGSGGYGERIKKRQHFILMIMADNKPRYTAQMKVANGKLVTVQIKDIGNRNLNPTELLMIETGLEAALQSRAHALATQESES